MYLANGSVQIANGWVRILNLAGSVPPALKKQFCRPKTRDVKTDAAMSIVIVHIIICGLVLAVAIYAQHKRQRAKISQPAYAKVLFAQTAGEWDAAVDKLGKKVDDIEQPQLSIPAAVGMRNPTSEEGSQVCEMLMKKENEL
jgi:hypothetical protein